MPGRAPLISYPAEVRLLDGRRFRRDPPRARSPEWGPRQPGRRGDCWASGAVNLPCVSCLCVLFVALSSAWEGVLSKGRLSFGSAGSRQPGRHGGCPAAATGKRCHGLSPRVLHRPWHGRGRPPPRVPRTKSDERGRLQARAHV